MAAGVLVACVGTDDARPPPLGLGPTEDGWCRALCGAYDRCEGNVGTGCRTACLVDNGAYFLRSSAAALDVEAECMRATTTCPNGFEEAIDTCFQASIGVLPPTAESEAVCEAMAEPFFECNWFGSPGSCASFHAGFSSGALAAWQNACSDTTCEYIETCMEITLFSYGE